MVRQTEQVTVIPMFPLQSVLLPGSPLQLQVFEPRYRALLADVLADGSGRFGVVLIERGREVGGGDDRADVGTVAEIVRHAQLPDGRSHLVCLGTDRIRVRRWLHDDPYPQAEADVWPDEPVPSDIDWAQVCRPVAERVDRLWEIHCTAAELAGTDPGDTPFPPPGIDSATALWSYAAASPIGDADRYRVLCAPDPVTRAEVLAAALDDAEPLYRLRLLGET